MVLLVDQSWTAACVWSEVDQSSVAGSIEELGPSPTGGDVSITTQLSTWSDVDGAWTAIHGRVGPDVAEVVVTRDSGEPVTATVDGGRFAAPRFQSPSPAGDDSTPASVTVGGPRGAQRRQRSAAIRRSISLSWVVAPVIAARIDS